jgi:hypothetical protein
MPIDVGVTGILAAHLEIRQRIPSCWLEAGRPYTALIGYRATKPLAQHDAGRLL